MTLVLEQALNGLQFGVMLFLLAAGLTLIFGIMGLVNLAHGSFYMVGAYAAAWIGDHTHSFVLAILAGIAAAGVVGVACEVTLLKRLYARDHLDQVLATFGLILFFNEAAAMIFWPPAVAGADSGCVVGCCDARAGTALPGVSAGADRLRDRGCGRDVLADQLHAAGYAGAAGGDAPGHGARAGGADRVVVYGRVRVGGGVSRSGRGDDRASAVGGGRQGSTAS